MSKKKEKPKVCGNCKHGDSQFKAFGSTSLHCNHPDQEIRGEAGWGSLREWYNRFPCFELKDEAIQ